MVSDERNILSEYPYFFDGQFALENIQDSLVARYQAGIEKNQIDFIKIASGGFVHAKIMQWDSAYFGIPMARIEHFYFKNDQVIEELYNDLVLWFKFHGIKHISVRLNLRNRGGINFLTRQGFEFITGKLMLRTDMRKYSSVSTQDDGYRICYDIERNELTKLLEITTGNFTENRFILDSYLDPDKSVELYSHWVQQEVEKGQGNLAIIKKGSSIVGFSLTEKINVAGIIEAGFVNLIAVNPEFKRSGIGSILLNDSLRKFKMNGVELIYANVVSTNYSSLALFQSAGFKIYSNLVELRKYTV